MGGFQTALTNGYYAFPQFQKAYGVEVLPDEYQVTMT